MFYLPVTSHRKNPTPFIVVDLFALKQDDGVDEIKEAPKGEDQ